MRSIFYPLCLAAAGVLAAQADVTTVTIIDHITATGSNTVELPESLLKRLAKVESAPEEEEKETEKEEAAPRPQSGRMAGYRVQVFSDNNPRTAKSEAGSKKRVIDARFPQYQTYVTYTSPYWRLKVGDFRTQQEANAAAEELRKAFPAYSKEIRVVRDRVNISAN
ncbi:MAG: SPOR domain-containing protein [Muribaculaceae bacterium]|nr:SPOR domain-containing protein [Muribaculaceae bacterium]